MMRAGPADRDEALDAAAAVLEHYGCDDGRLMVLLVGDELVRHGWTFTRTFRAHKPRLKKGARYSALHHRATTARRREV
jgi:hypothetical protein